MNFQRSFIFFALAGGLLLVSCEVNDLQPQNQILESTAFQGDRLDQLVAGVYDGAQSGYYAGNVSRGYPFGAAHLEQGDMRGEDMISVQAFYAITYRTTYDATTPNNVFFWQTAYGMINKANVVLANLQTLQPTPALTQATINGYIAECRFLRAMGHHYLLAYFARPHGDQPTRAGGGIPYRVNPVTDLTSVASEIQKGRNTVAESYTLLLADLDYAEQNLPVSRGARSITRATRGAAIAMKMRIKLHQNDFAGVVTEGNKLVPATGNLISPVGGYQLTASPYGPFGGGNKSNTESVFSIENNDVDNGGVNGGMGSMYTASTLGGRGIIAISPILWNQPYFPATDLRKSPLMVAQDGPANPGRGGYFTRKYPDFTNRTDNAPIIRYADVLLMLAEATSRTSSAVDPRAVTLLSAVRNRAVPDAANQYTVASFATGQALTRAIINERRVEFVGEGVRWLDIHRLSSDATFSQSIGIPAKAAISITNYAPLYTNNPSTTFTQEPAILYNNYRFLWPIPVEEIINNPTLAQQQNPGY
ncbi:MAG: RagB/SusD family nutrient uptake outer membrane protein [Bacteroidetes bacterium]|nr:RagB/SusD family nutrient uptake outer membrane protein [Fibrella sp.]